MDAESQTLRCSVLLASRDEGESLRRTVDDILLHAGAGAGTGGPVETEGAIEIVVVDDASSDGSTEFLSLPQYAGERILAVRNETRRGLIYSRARAADLAGGEYLAFLDAHCAVTPGWLDGLSDHLQALGGEGVVLPAVHELIKETWGIDRSRPPGLACTISSPFLDFAWCAPRSVDGFPSSCVMPGGAWLTSRSWYRHVGGLDRGMLSWGAENVDFALRTWLAGGRCIVADEVSVGHLFSTRPRRQDPLQDPLLLSYNKIRAAHNAFGMETFNRLLECLRYLPMFPEALRRFLEVAEEVAAFKVHAESIRKRTDTWLLETFGLPLFESPVFHEPTRTWLPSRRSHARPLVAVVLSAEDGADPRPAVASLLEGTAYGNHELLLLGRDPAPFTTNLADLLAAHPRFRVGGLPDVPRAGSGLAALVNLAARSTGAEYLVLLDSCCRAVDPHWLERLLLLAEKRDRLLLASPRVVAVDGSSEDVFEAIWDWDATGLQRLRRGAPLSERPYQALSCPETALFLHRERFLELGGFDSAVEGGLLPVLDLAIRGWLSGLEVFCAPHVRMGAEGPPAAVAAERRWIAYAGALGGLKCFSKLDWIEGCRRSSADGSALIERDARRIAEARREFLEKARFDDDWLSYKFGIPDPEVSGRASSRGGEA